MAAIRRTDTKPEIALRSLLHAQGLRFRKDYRITLAGRHIRPDIAFTKRKVAVFVDGCFWHACPEHGRQPANNTSYWSQKLATNTARDTLQTQLLKEAGWQVVRFWEHDGPEFAAGQLTSLLRTTSLT